MYRKHNRKPRIESLESRMLLNSYWVSPGGSDSGAGTSSSAAFRTLQHAADLARAGDTVHVLAGTYAGMDLTGSAYPGGTSASPITFIAGSGDWRTSGVNVTSLSSKGQGYASINLESNGGGYVIEGFNVIGGGGQKAGIRVANSHNCQVLNNQVSGTFTGVFASLADGILVQGNSCHDATDQHGIYVNGTDGYTIRANTCYNNNWDGIHTNVLDGGNTINLNGLIEGNLVYNNTLSGFDITGANTCTFRNNIAYGNARHGMVLQNTNQNPTPACQNLLIENNTFDARAGQWAIEVTAGNDANVTLFDNVLLGGSGGGGIGAAGSLPASFLSDYNATDGNYSESYGGPALESLSKWQSDTGQDRHSIIASPAQLFVNPSSPDYHLRSGSPAVDAGAASLGGHAAAAFDFDGARRSPSRMDIGAHRFMRREGAALRQVGDGGK